MAERLDSFARALIIGLFGLLPFFFIPFPWAGVVQSKIMLTAVVLGIAAICFLIARLSDGIVRLPWTSVLAFVSLIPLAYAISSAVGGLQSVSLWGSGTDADSLATICIGVSLLFLSTAVFSGKPGSVVHAIRALVAGSLVMLIVQIVHIALPSFNVGGLFSSPAANVFGSWHEFAILSGLAAFLGLALQNTAFTRGYWSLIFLAASIATLPLLIIAGFFDVWAILFASLVALLAVKGYKADALRSTEFWRSQWMYLVAAVVALFFVVFGSFVTTALPERIRVPHVEVRPSWQGTISISRQALAEPRTLFFGSGPNTFVREWGLYKPLSVNQTLFWNTDFNVGAASIPTSFITTGILGILAWILFAVAVLLFVSRLWIYSGRTPSDQLSIGALYLLAFLALSVPGTVLTLITFLLLGITIAALAPHYFEERAVGLGFNDMRSSISLVAVLVLVALAAGASALDARVVFAEWYVNRGIVSYNTTGKTEEAGRLIARAISIYPSDRAHRAAVELGLLQLRALAQSTDPNQEAAKAELQKTLETTIQHGLSAVSLNSNDFQNWLGLASLYAELAGANVTGAYDNARSAYQKAREQNPTSPVPLLNLARLEMLQQKPDEALQFAAAAAELKQDYAPAYYVASQAYVLKKDSENALRAAALAVQYAQNDSQAWYNYGLIAYDAKKFSDAAVALEQAIARQEKFANALYVLGLSYYELKRTDDAIKTFEKLAEIDPNQEVVKRALDNLRNNRPPLETAAPARATTRGR